VHQRIGQLLGRMVPLSDHDVAEILEDQFSTRRRFGEIAMAWGLCQPQHVVRAWARQCSEGQKQIDLSRFTIDAQAVALLPREIAQRLAIIPLRSCDGELIIATATPIGEQDDEVSRELNMRCHFVLADPEQIRRAIATYYNAA
jgi:hypothetical protein